MIVSANGKILPGVDSTTGGQQVMSIIPGDLLIPTRLKVDIDLTGTIYTTINPNGIGSPGYLFSNPAPNIKISTVFNNTCSEIYESDGSPVNTADAEWLQAAWGECLTWTYTANSSGNTVSFLKAPMISLSELGFGGNGSPLSHPNGFVAFVYSIIRNIASDGFLLNPQYTVVGGDGGIATPAFHYTTSTQPITFQLISPPPPTVPTGGGAGDIFINWYTQGTVTLMPLCGSCATGPFNLQNANCQNSSSGSSSSAPCQNSCTQLGAAGTYSSAFDGTLYVLFNDTIDAWDDNTGSFTLNWPSGAITIPGNSSAGIAIPITAGVSYPYTASGTINNGTGDLFGPGGNASHDSVAQWTLCPLASYGALIGLFVCASGSGGGSGSSSGGSSSSGSSGSIICPGCDNLPSSYLLTGTLVQITITGGVPTYTTLGPYRSVLYQNGSCSYQATGASGSPGVSPGGGGPYPQLELLSANGEAGSPDAVPPGFWNIFYGSVDIYTADNAPGSGVGCPPTAAGLSSSPVIVSGISDGTYYAVENPVIS